MGYHPKGQAGVFQRRPLIHVQFHKGLVGSLPVTGVAQALHAAVKSGLTHDLGEKLAIAILER